MKKPLVELVWKIRGHKDFHKKLHLANLVKLSKVNLNKVNYLITSNDLIDYEECCRKLYYKSLLKCGVETTSLGCRLMGTAILRHKSIEAIL